MKTKANQKEKTPLQKSLAKIGITPQKFAGVLKRLGNLKRPAAPLKGRGHARETLGVPFNTETAKRLWSAIPDSHKCEVAYRRTGGYFGHTVEVSPEAAKVCAEIVAAINAVTDAARNKQVAKEHAAHIAWRQANRAAKQATSPRPQEPRPQPCGSLAASRLSEPERDELRALLAAGQHPFTGRALELKHASGLSWGQIENS